MAASSYVGPEALMHAIECPTCLECFDENKRVPRLLGCCSHTFCSECLTALLRAVVFDHTGNGALSCPVDRSLTQVNSDSGIDQFKKNFAMLDVVNSLKQNSQAIIEVPVHQQDQKQKPAEQPRDSSARLFVWGYNRHGQLGIGDLEDKVLPQEVMLPGLTTAAQIHCGGGHTAVLLENGQLYVWGRNAHGEVGVSGVVRYSVPQVVITGHKIARICCGGHHSVATIADSVELVVWGNNNAGQLGLGSVPTSTPKILHISKQFLPGESVTQLACGCYHTVALTRIDTGDAFVWGCNSNGELGLGHWTNEKIPKRLKYSLCGNSKFAVVSCGCHHTAVIRDCGDVFTWGCNKRGELGLRHTENVNSPRPVSMLASVELLTCGCHHTTVVLDNSTLVTWGSNNHSQLCVSAKIDYIAEPVAIGYALPAKIRKIASGGYHTTAVLVCWGNNCKGCLATGDKVDRHAPYLVTFSCPSSAIDICCGWGHTVSLIAPNRS